MPTCGLRFCGGGYYPTCPRRAYFFTPGGFLRFTHRKGLCSQDLARVGVACDDLATFLERLQLYFDKLALLRTTCGGARGGRKRAPERES